jgi:cytochrome c oxidase assembly protein subunit 15
MPAKEFLQLLFIGLSVAAVPLAIVWFSRGERSAKARYRKLVAITLFFTLDLILFGAFTRLTDSGLGCPDWPGCYSTSSPLDALKQIRAAESAQPGGPVTLTKAWIEMLHRYLAKGLGVLCIALMVLAWWQRRALQQSPWLATALFIGVCIQGAFGAFTVTLKLMPLIVTLHLLGGVTLLAMLAWLYARQQELPVLATGQAAWLRPWAWGALALLTMQIALGGWVSTNYAALACMDFPTCQGQWLPEMDFAHGYTLLRGLGQTGGGDALPFAALTAIHWVHRNFAFVVFGYMGWLAWRAADHGPLRKLALLIAALLAWQLVTGLTTVFLKWPLPVALVHNGGAAALVLVTTLLIARLTLGLPRSTMHAAPAIVATRS